MPISETLSPQEAIAHLLSARELFGFLDVRAESEWGEGAIEGVTNCPILTDEERHLVGTCYKENGNAQATQLGYELTAPFKAARISAWQELSKSNGIVVNCWRGGARSRIACEWLNTAGVNTYRVLGGYKALRAYLRESMQTLPPMVILSGATGTGKTLLLRKWRGAKVDLELLARHRGSAFGALGVQPSQQSFENRLALAFLSAAAPALVEDESRLIGCCEIPKHIKDAMYQSPVVVLTASIEERMDITFDEYVAEPLRQGVPRSVLFQQLQGALNNIQRKLGPARHGDLSRALIQAIDQGDKEGHARWIVPLLTEYYDPQYHYAFQSKPRNVLFRGNQQEVLSYLSRYL